jgi:hypothetical protein
VEQQAGFGHGPGPRWISRGRSSQLKALRVRCPAWDFWKTPQAAGLAVVAASLHEYRGRQVANVAWALARLGLPSGGAFLREHLLDAAYPLLPWCGGRIRVASGLGFSGAVLERIGVWRVCDGARRV